LWPESSPENARKSFDTLLARLRKLMSPHLPIPVKHYLYTQKGILCLENYEIDGLDFFEAARTGLSHSKNGDWLQAYAEFRTAFSLYRGMMPEDTFKSEQVLVYNDELVNLFVEFTTAWAQHMVDSGRSDEAIGLIEKILQINLLEENLTTLLYNLHTQNNNLLKARSVLDRYKKALQRADYSKEEIEEILENLIRSGDIYCPRHGVYKPT